MKLWKRAGKTENSPATTEAAVLNQNDTKLDLNSWVSVENHSGAAYKNAVLKLVAGDVNLITPGRTQPFAYTEEMRMDKGVAPQQFQEKEFFEYHIYNLQRPATLAQTKQNKFLYSKPGMLKQLKSFITKAADIVPIITALRQVREKSR